MPVNLTCSCGCAISVPDQFAGNTVKCPACGAALGVTASDATDRPSPQATPGLPQIMPPRNAAPDPDAAPAPTQPGPALAEGPALAVTPDPDHAPALAPAPDPVSGPAPGAAPAPELEPAHDEHALRKEARREARKTRGAAEGRKDRAGARASRRGRRKDREDRKSRRKGKAPAEPDPAPPQGRRAQATPVPPGPAPVVDATSGRCPACNAPLVRNAVLCKKCGAGLRTGGFMLGGEEEGKSHSVLRSIGGPAAALVLIVGVIVAWRAGVFSGDSSGKPGAAGSAASGNATAGAAGDAKPPSGDAASAVGGTSDASAAGTPERGRFSGGTVTGTVELADARAPYEIAETVRLAAGATLRVGPGVALKSARGADEVEVRLTGGDLVIEGSAAKPAAMSIAVKVSGARGGLAAKYTVFAGPVSVEGSVACRVENATFLRGLRLAAKGGSGTAEWRFEQCDLHPLDGRSGACLDVDVAAPSGRHKIFISKSNMKGGLKGTVGWSSRLDLGSNHWSIPTEDALNELKANGRVVLEPARSEAVAGAGASADGASYALPAGGGRTLVNKDMGFEIAVPEGWRPAGKSMLLAPKSYRHSTKIQIERRLGVKDPAKLPDFLAINLRKSRARNINAGRPAKLEVAGVEGLSFRCSFEIGAEKWVRRAAIVPAGGHILTIMLSARAGDAEELTGAFDEAVKSFRILGGK